MHEYSITKSIIDILEEISRKNNIQRIEKVNFIVSPIASIEPESIKFYYGYMTAENDLLGSAELIFEKALIKIKCLDCNNVFKKKEFEPVCTKCGSSNVQVQELEDIKIVSVET